ncbi:hypothetical protein [Streptomyces sp. NPDC058254]|uniref:hypothetical protein n=1 Tax=Streptomyces sp. NPDC058254 TaxID=3346406 RepID=UPI0036E86BC0
MSRYATHAVIALFSIALAVGAIGWGTHDEALMWGGFLGSIAITPVLTLAIANRAHRASDEQLAAAHCAGYQLALDQVSRGLLDPSDGATPPHGHPNDITDTDDAGSIPRLHIIRSDREGKRAV